MTMRVFDDNPAVRERTPLLLGMVGPSSSGKTYSALRLATGIQRIAGGEIFMIDTEARRGLHYADTFKFRHVPFGAPFSPLDYLAAIEHCVAKGAKTIIIDSFSHEHEGPGGVLEMHAAETQRIAKAWRVSEDKAKMSAWGKPKTERRRLINAMLQIDCNFIWCFRAKKKLKIVRGKEPEQLGYMPIAGDEFVYEAVLKCLMLPGANGVPLLSSDFEGEREMIKIPNQFRQLFASPIQLTEDVGEELARWAAGTAAPKAVTVEELRRSYQACSDAATYRTLEQSRRLLWAKAKVDEKKTLKDAADAALERVERASATQQEEPTGDSEPEYDENGEFRSREPGEDAP